MIHELKTMQPYFDDVSRGKKMFEVRKADRGYSVGDFVALNEYIENYECYDEIENLSGEYTGRCILLKIVCILMTHIIARMVM